MYRIGELAALGGLSRSTLLYYDRIGLLSPSGRSEANYRLYSAEDRERTTPSCSPWGFPKRRHCQSAHCRQARVRRRLGADIDGSRLFPSSPLSESFMLNV